MYYIKDEFSQTFEEKKSKFIAHICSYDSFDLMMERLRKEHPKGRHFVYAYRYLNEFGQIVENSSDDGEPKGTSGKPSLTVLAGNNLINTGVIIVRYFGGTKLGTGGLVRAYGDSVNLVINSSKMYKYQKLDDYFINVEYNALSKIEYLLNSLDVKIISKEFNESVKLNLSISDAQNEKLKEYLPRNIKLNNL